MANNEFDTWAYGKLDPFNAYTEKLSHEDVRCLYGMVDAIANNPNQYTLEADFEGHPHYTDTANPGQNLVYVIDMIAREGERLELITFMYNTPFEDLPTHINDRDPFGVVARWRLKIGK